MTKTTRRRFALKVGGFLGVFAFFLSIPVSFCIFFSEWGFLSCLPISVFLAPIASILELFNVNSVRLGFIFFAIGSFFFYYIIGYLIGLIFFGFRNFFGEGIRDWKG